MLAPLLATEDPYAAASIFSQAGWKVEYESARDGDQPRACLSLAHSRIELVPPTDPYVVPRGLGVEFLIHVPPHELSGLFLLHRAGVEQLPGNGPIARMRLVPRHDRSESRLGRVNIPRCTGS